MKKQDKGQANMYKNCHDGPETTSCNCSLIGNQGWLGLHLILFNLLAEEASAD